MRIVSKAGAAVAGLLLSASALACDSIVPAQQTVLQTPGKHCLSANRSLPIRIDGSNIELDCRSRSIVNPNPGFGDRVGIETRPGDNVIVRNCRVDGFEAGIQMDVGSGAQLLNNTVLRSPGVPIIVHGNPFQGPPGPQAEPARIVGNRVLGYERYPGQPANGAPAISVHGLPRAVVANNVVAGYSGQSGLSLGESPDAQVTGNQLLDFDHGRELIRFANSPRPRVVHNTIMSREQNAIYGLAGAVEATCVENVFINVAQSGFGDCAVARYNVEHPRPPSGP